MLMKKGKEWALSCVAVSTLVLTGMCTTVHADATTDQGSADSTTAVENSTTNDSLGSVTTTANEGATTQAGAQSAITQSANSDVQDGGNVSDDFSNEGDNQLGYASNFHVFANEATLNAHTNGNVAVGTLHGNVNFGTNVHEGHVNKDISYVQNHTKMSNSSFVNKTDSRDNKVIFGEDNDVNVTNPNRTNVDGTDIDHLTKDETYQDKDGNKYIDFSTYFNKLESKSNSLANQDPQVTVKNSDFPDQNQRVINLEHYQPTADNKIVINLDADVLNANTPLTIYGLSADQGGTTIIINVDTKGQDPYDVNSQIKLIYNDGDSNNNVERPNQETEYFDDNHLLWNFYDSTASDKLYDGQVNIDRPFQGSVLAPKATVVVNQNLDGNIVADKVIVNAETHRWDLQDDDTKTDTEFERPITIPGELPDLPGEEENNGGNIENPDEEEVEEDIDPDTGDLIEVDGGSEAEKPDTGDNGNEEDNNTEDDDDEDANESEDNNESNESTEDNNTDETDDIGNEDNLITNGGSESTVPNNGLEEGLLSNVNGSSNGSQASNSNSGTLPQTGETTGTLATIIGVIMAAFAFILKTTRIKKED
ncbi:collagen-binding domain-containing protein [Companilactobacillus musae]|uniref:collagen-binding domain-containing protein n=1 Tax=Companilactobacillus musae TaxID=1903258 RepID=UPI000E654478|nr:collagen-binding domain-containing protein [Companilactobacillus musae]